MRRCLARRQRSSADRGVWRWRLRLSRPACRLRSRPVCQRQRYPNLQLGFSADAREYGIGSQILADLGLTTIRVLTNNPKKISGISGFGLSVVSQEPIEIEPNPENRRYLESKRDKMGHTIGQPEHHQRVRFDPESS